MSPRVTFASEPAAAQLVQILETFLLALFFAVGVSIALLVSGPVCRGEGRAKVVVTVLSLGLLLPQLLTWTRLGNPAPALAVLYALIALVATAGVLMISERRASV